MASGFCRIMRSPDTYYVLLQKKNSGLDSNRVFTGKDSMNEGWLHRRSYQALSQIVYYFWV